MRTIRIGDLLVEHGVLTPEQRDEILRTQQKRGRPFGVLAEELFGVAQEAVERAWAAQYASYSVLVDPRQVNVDPEAAKLISRRQAWQFRILPMGFKGGDLVACTTEMHLPRAMKFAGWRLGQDCHFVLSDPTHLAETMLEQYPMNGMSVDVITGTGMPV